ncbi:MAG: tetratricopeptide repeat protein [bacterium]|nr:tetratricopeptide repeat protein [bacterium]
MFQRISLTAATVGALILVSTVGCHWRSTGQNLQGVRLVKSGQYAPALEKFQQAAATSPKNADAYYNMGATFHHMARQSRDPAAINQAETLYNQCLDIDPDHTDCYRGLAVLLAETDRKDAAQRLLENWARSNPTSAEPRIELARIYHEFGNTETARLHVNQALQNDPYNARAWRVAGYMQEQEGNSLDALAYYQRSYQRDTMQPDLANRIAALQQRTNAQMSTLSGQNGTRLVTPQPTTARY